MIRRKGAPRHRAGGGEVDCELVRDGGVLDVGDALRREQRSEDMAILAGLRRGKRGERADRQAEVEADPVEVTGGIPAPVSMSRRCSGRSFRISSTMGKMASRPRSIMERPPILTTCSQGRSRIGRPPATGRVSSLSRRVWRASGEATCLMLLVDSAMAVIL